MTPKVGPNDPSAFIVKVQTPLSDPTHPALIYDEMRSFELFEPVEHVAERMAGKAKAFFYAKIVGDKLVLGEGAPDQEW